MYFSVKIYNIQTKIQTGIIYEEEKLSTQLPFQSKEYIPTYNYLITKVFKTHLHTLKTSFINLNFLLLFQIIYIYTPYVRKRRIEFYP